MTDFIVIEELQTYLIAQGVGIDPSATPSTALPSIWLEPRDGIAPEPRRNGNGQWLENETITLVDSNTVVPPTGQEFLQEAIVDVVVRARSNPKAKLIQRQVRGLLAGDLPGGKKMWMMGGLLVEYSTAWRGDQPDGGDELTFRRTQSFRLCSRLKALAGLPYAS